MSKKSGRPAVTLGKRHEKDIYFIASGSQIFLGYPAGWFFSFFATGFIYLLHFLGGGKGDTRRARESKAALEAAALEHVIDDGDHRSLSVHRSYSRDRDSASTRDRDRERERNGSSSRHRSRSRDRDRERDRDRDSKR